MVRYIITAFLFVAVVAKAQEPITFITADSITYQCFLTGDWDKLIKTGKQAIGQNIDFKRLRQRIGYAYFAKADYYAAQKHYEKALTFDEYDFDTRAYLYYCGLNNGNEVYARFQAGKLPIDIQQKMSILEFKPIDAIDLEFNYKANNISTRTNPTYLRAGIATKLGYRLSLYQSVSTYQQTVDASITKQPEYFASLVWSVTSRLSLDVAYHYLNTIVGGYRLPGNLVFGSLSSKFNRFNLGINGSIFSNTTDNYMQFGLQAGVTLPGKSNIYLKSSVIGMIETGRKRTIFSQNIGMKIAKTVWAEGNITLGDLLNYNDHNGLYVYNSIDPTTFRTGGTLFWYIGKNATLFGNYTYDTKQVSLTKTNYKQQSFSGGIIWKL